MAGAAPRYRLIADQLMREIRDQRLTVGSRLPTEGELMRAYGASRHTVRAAVRELRSLGIVSSRQGQGSTVVSVTGQVAFAEKIQSIDELIAFGQETRRELLSRRIVDADPRTAGLFGCRPGRRLSMARMLRRAQKGDRKIALVTLWMDALLDEVVADLARVQRSAAEIIRDRYGLGTRVVEQTIEAECLDAEAAEILESDPGAPALIVTRAYFASGGGAPFLLARSTCRADAFRVVSSFVAPD